MGERKGVPDGSEDSTGETRRPRLLEAGYNLWTNRCRLLLKHSVKTAERCLGRRPLCTEGKATHVIRKARRSLSALSASLILQTMLRGRSVGGQKGAAKVGGCIERERGGPVPLVHDNHLVVL